MFFPKEFVLLTVILCACDSWVILRSLSPCKPGSAGCAEFQELKADKFIVTTDTAQVDSVKGSIEYLCCNGRDLSLLS